MTVGGKRKKDIAPERSQTEKPCGNYGGNGRS
jgi:hypothetical protein